MDFSDYFRPLNEEIKHSHYPLDNYAMGNFAQINYGIFPDFMNADIVIIGADEDRGGKEIEGCHLAPDVIREHLYALAVPRREVKIADLGNLIKRDTMVEYYDALAQVLAELLRRDKTVLILGGTQDIAYGQYMGYEALKRKVEYVCIDSRIDVEDSDFGINNHSFNHKVFIHSPNFLFNFTNIGYQSHYVSFSDQKRLKNLYFNAVRLGKLRDDLREAEPYIRSADLVSMDLSACRSSDAPGTTRTSPAGFTTEEMCQLARYAGMSSKVSSLSLCEVNPLKDLNEQSSALAALCLWYFIDGFYNRRDEEPLVKEEMKKYRIGMNSGAQEIVFYKNELTERWWMEVPFTDAIGQENGRTKLVACSEGDYERARQDDIPEKWWLTHYKLK